MKELLLMVLDIAANNQNRALNHMESARRAGLTRAQLCEAVMAVFLVFGVSGLTHIETEAVRVWDTAAEAD